MEKVDQDLDRLIEKISSHMLLLDPGSKEFGALAARLDALLRQRNNRFKDEMTAVENENRLEFDHEKLEVERKANEARNELDRDRLRADALMAKKRNRTDIFKTLGGIAEVIIGAGVSAYLVLSSENMEYSEHLNVKPKVWNLIPKIKTKH